ncbi:enoyl-CoA hydratase/isomerase family protein [Sphingopyxis lindanitolerans]|nr:enoyl-CoA hydratase/isomerase family protein [Sphingopyxis lindanitolerans]
MSKAGYSGFRLDIDDDGIALIRFDRPDRLNVLDISAKRDLIEALTQLQYDDACRVLIFTGEGRTYCAGDDVKGAFAEEQWEAARSQPVRKGRKGPIATYSSLRTISQQLNRTLMTFDKITIAAINGAAVQSGFSLALCCDFRLVAESAKMGSGTMRMGFLPDEGGHHLLVRLIGIARTKDLLLRGRLVGADEAAALGLVHEIVSPGALLDRARALALEFAHGPQVALRLLKNAIDSAVDLGFEQAAMDIAARAAISDHHPDAEEGWRAFREKRRPAFE